MKTRLLTGLALAGAVLAVVLAAPFAAIHAMVALVTALSADEFARMAPATEAERRRLRVITVIGALLPIAGAAWGGLPGLGAALPLAAIAVLAATLFAHGDMATVGARAAHAVAGVLYVGGLFAALPLLEALEEPFGRYGLILLFLVVFLGDTGAYFAGRAFGRHKLAPSVSPKKTWEGAVGGVFGSLAGAFGGCYAMGIPLAPAHIAGVAVAGAVAEQVGDLCESLFKRSFGVKDSGTLLPGHGGMLDRIDGLLFAAPVVALWLLAALR